VARIIGPANAPPRGMSKFVAAMLL
jgi:hypothetical protein